MLLPENNETSPKRQQDSKSPPNSQLFIVEPALTSDFLRIVLKAPFVKSNKPGTSEPSANDVAAFVDSPNGTKIAHKLAYPGNERILRILDQHPNAFAILDGVETAAVSTLGADYNSCHATYNLFDKGTIIPSSGFRITVAKKK